MRAGRTLRRTSAFAAIALGIAVAGAGVAVAEFPSGEGCRSVGVTDSARTPLGPWRAPPRKADPTPLNCGGYCPPQDGVRGTCQEWKVESSSGQMGEPPPGGAEYTCACIYLRGVDGVLVTIAYFDSACDMRIHKDADGNPAPWNQDPGAGDYRCVGTCGAGTCQQRLSSCWRDDDGVWHREVGGCDCR